jgi:aryl-alcohol dehydrogenase-like predicted oxidoreductase
VIHLCNYYILYSQALKQLPREKVQVATKFGVVKLEGDQYGRYGVRGTPEYVRQCCEASLKRLDIDYIDLYFPHRIDITVPIEDTVSIKSNDTTNFKYFTIVKVTRYN